jgi:hypothetical protein
VESSLIIDIVGNGPSCYDFVPCGNITVGCSSGLLTSKPDWLMMQDEFSMDCIADGITVAIAPIYLSTHAIYFINTFWEREKRDKFLSKISLKKLTQTQLSTIPDPFKFSKLNIIKYGRNYEWDLPISCGCMAVLFAIVKHNPTHIRCWGFDAHKEGKVVDLDHHLNRSNGYAIFDESILRRNRDEKYMHNDDSTRGEEYANRGFLWQKTLEGINSYFPEVKIEIV